MKEFKGKVAVITGAASGIGRALAMRSAREGMKVVLADINDGDLAQAERELRPRERRLAGAGEPLTLLTSPDAPRARQRAGPVV